MNIVQQLTDMQIVLVISEAEYRTNWRTAENLHNWLAFACFRVF